MLDGILIVYQMEFISKNNKYLIVKEGVVLTAIIDKSIAAVDTFFKDCPAFVVSGLRDAEHQLRIMRDYSVKLKIDKQYPAAMTCKVTDRIFLPSDLIEKNQYVWQMMWSRLLHEGIIINPSLQSKLLLDYFGTDGKGKNRKGGIFPQSNHIAGKAYNVGGSKNGPNDEAACIDAAIKAKIGGIKSRTLERNNNCLHVDCI